MKKTNNTNILKIIALFFITVFLGIVIGSNFPNVLPNEFSSPLRNKERAVLHEMNSILLATTAYLDQHSGIEEKTYDDLMNLYVNRDFLLHKIETQYGYYSLFEEKGQVYLVFTTNDKELCENIFFKCEVNDKLFLYSNKIELFKRI